MVSMAAHAGAIGKHTAHLLRGTSSHLSGLGGRVASSIGTRGWLGTAQHTASIIGTSALAHPLTALAVTGATIGGVAFASGGVGHRDQARAGPSQVNER